MHLNGFSAPQTLMTPNSTLNSISSILAHQKHTETLMQQKVRLISSNITNFNN